MFPEKRHPTVALKLAIVPVVFYLGLFCALTFPLIRHISTVSRLGLS